MSAEQQAHPQSAEWARIIYSGLENASPGPYTTGSGATYVSTGDSRMIAGSTINVEKFEVNNYGEEASARQTERKQIIEWLADTVDNIKQQTSIFSKAEQCREAEPESGSWLLGNQEFKLWLTGDIKTLWLHGGVGCGKTVLSTSIIRNLQISCTNGPGPRVFYHFCSFRYAGQESQSMLILRMILTQIVSSSASIPEVVLELYNKCRRSNPWQAYGTEINPPSPDQLKRAMLSALHEIHQSFKKPLSELNAPEDESRNNILSRIFLVIDGLDELKFREHHSTLEYLRIVANLGFVQLLITSRTQPNIEQILVKRFSWPTIIINKAVVRQDIDLFVSNSINHSSLQELPADLQQEIKMTLVQRGEGMFLWVSLQLRHLQDLGVGHVETIRSELRTLPEDLHETYTRIFNRILPRLQPKAVRVLRWLAFTRRPLFMNELSEACGIKDDLSKVPDLREPNGLEPKHINEILCDLIYVDPPLSEDSAGSCTVALAHASVHDFLIGNEAIEEAGDPKPPFLALYHNGVISNADLFLGECCLAYVFSFNRPGTSKESHPFLRYAWYHWEEHLKSESLSPDNKEKSYLRLMAARMFEGMPEKYRHHLGWLPLGGEKRLLDALDIPYFYQGFNDFKLDMAMNTWMGTRKSHISKSRPVKRLESYAYMPLSASETRLLDILPSLSRFDPIFCRLTALSIEKAPTFDAISYVWGSPEVSRDVYVNGVQMTLTRNLVQILQNLRLRSEADESHLWVDVISINQDDIKERAHQVPMLATIFGSARRVLISFGSAKNGDDTGIKNLIATAKLIRSSTSVNQHELFKFILNPTNKILQLFQREYWTSIWIIQEVALAKDLRILIGHLSFDLEHLACLSIFGLDKGELDCYISSGYTASGYMTLAGRVQTQGLRNVLNLLQTRHEFRSRGECDFLESLLRFRDNDTPDGRDRIYGLLGLLGRRKLQLKVDYSISLEEVHLNATKLILRNDRNLRVLSYKPVRTVDRWSSPSWAMSPLNLGSRVISLLGEELKGSNLYSAGGNTIGDELQLDGKVLSLNGATVAIIKSKLRCPGTESDFKWGSTGKPIVETHTNDPEIPHEAAHQHMSAMEIRWRTLLADQFPHGQRLISSRYKGCSIPPTTSSEEADLWLKLHTEGHFQHLEGRELFTAEIEEQNVLMLGPSTAQPGDIAVVLFGGTIPFVLRPAGDEFLLMGECYIHGVMDGELLESESLKKQVFKLI